MFSPQTTSLLHTLAYLAAILFGSPIVFFAGWLFTGSFLIGVITGTVAVVLPARAMIRSIRDSNPAGPTDVPGQVAQYTEPLGHAYAQPHNPNAWGRPYPSSHPQHDQGRQNPFR